MTDHIARRPSTLAGVPVFAWHPDDATFAVISASPALPPHPVFADELCQCGRQLLDTSDQKASGHDGRRVFTWQGLVFGSAKCAGAYYAGGPNDDVTSAPDREAQLVAVVREFLSPVPRSWPEEQVLITRAQMLVGGAA